jgi:predicted  nucleic acid-binding Zn-ribbon protein
MPDPQIEKLLILQDRDITLQRIEKELLRVPRERSLIEDEIVSQKAKIETAYQTIKELEVERHEVDSEVKGKEAANARFRTQQLEVKKNEEYRALTHQIEQNEADILKLEEREIELMLQIDTARETFEAEKSDIETSIKDREEKIKQLAENETNLQAQTGEAQSKLEEARAATDTDYLAHYDRIKVMVKRAPYVVPLADHKCGGCHLRVSNEVAGAVRNTDAPAFCDQCARMVYA